MNLNRVLLNVIYLGALIWGVSACSTVNHKVGAALNLDTDLKIEISADKFINPDEQDQSSPVVLRLYELTSTQLFEKADFIDLYERDEEILGATFVAKQELKSVVPNTTRTERFVLSKDTRFIAIFAEFYSYKNAKTKVVFPVTASNVVRNSVVVNVSGTDLSWNTPR
ncbi:MAG: type VI secretion system lipoprotein TssJ [Agarilytica sp.]